MSLDLQSATHFALPLVALLLGLGGGLHCAGMCGPLVVSVAPTKKSNFLYQVGRLFGYLVLCFVVSLAGQAALQAVSPTLQVWFSVAIAVVFIYIGFTLFVGKGLHHLSFGWSAKAFQASTKYFGSSNRGINTRAFGVGLSSIFLPCALLYGVVFTLIASHGLGWALVAIVAFWAGTLPAMLLGPVAFRKLIAPFVAKAPRLAGSLCIAIGLVTLYYRFFMTGVGQSCH